MARVGGYSGELPHCTVSDTIEKAGLTEDGILPQIEVAFALRDLMATSRCVCPRPVIKTVDNDNVSRVIIWLC